MRQGSLAFRITLSTVRSALAKTVRVCNVERYDSQINSSEVQGIIAKGYPQPRLGGSVDK